MFVNTCRCHVRVTSFDPTKKIRFVSFSHLVNLEEFSLLIGAGKAQYNISAEFQCFGEQYATMRIQLTDQNGLRGNEVFTGEF